MEHTAVIFVPDDLPPDSAAQHKGKVVIVSHGYGDPTVEGNYGEPIAARMGYPTMVIPIPGEYDGHPGESSWIYFCQSLQRSTRDPINSANFRQAVAYLRALDVFGMVLGEDNVRAVIGGHSKRAPSAFLAAAMDAERIAGVVYMGNEGRITPGNTDYLRPVRPFYAQKYVQCPVIYIGATNEDGYEMFNINRNQAVLEKPWTIAHIPNYRHANRSEKQFHELANVDLPLLRAAAGHPDRRFKLHRDGRGNAFQLHDRYPEQSHSWPRCGMCSLRIFPSGAT